MRLELALTPDEEAMLREVIALRSEFHNETENPPNVEQIVLRHAITSGLELRLRILRNLTKNSLSVQGT